VDLGRRLGGRGRRTSEVTVEGPLTRGPRVAPRVHRRDVVLDRAVDPSPPREALLGRRRLVAGRPDELLFEDLVAETDALVADVDAWAGDQFRHLPLALPAEAARQELIPRRR